MRGLIVFFLAALSTLGFLAYQSPRVRELFESAQPPKPAAVVKRPAPAKTTPAPPPEPEPAAEPAASTAAKDRPKPKKASAPTPPPASQPPPKPTVSNLEVSSVLMGIFRARQIYGVSLAVSDAEIEVSGEVTSEQQRRQVLNTIEKAREYRRVNAEGLKVRQP